MRSVEVTGGVDTHADVHVAAAVDHNGGLLGVESFPADRTGFEGLLVWLVGFGPVEQVGVEGTGSWGVGLSRFLADHDVTVVEVDRPNRQQRLKVSLAGPGALPYPFVTRTPPRVAGPCRSSGPNPKSDIVRCRWFGSSWRVSVCELNTSVAT